MNIPSPEEIHALAVSKGWYDCVDVDHPERLSPDFFPAKLALVHSELSEALEAYRKHGLPLPWYEPNMGEGSIPEELADAVIRIMDLAGLLHIDLEAVILPKHAYNQKRPYRHGGKVV